MTVKRKAPPTRVTESVAEQMTERPGAPALEKGLDLLVIASGAVTAIPLWFFGEAARRLRLSTLAFIQYLAPSLQKIRDLTSLASVPSCPSYLAPIPRGSASAAAAHVASALLHDEVSKPGSQLETRRSPNSLPLLGKAS